MKLTNWSVIAFLGICVCKPTTTLNARTDLNVVIRSIQSGLVLDGAEHEVKLQHFTGWTPQLWRFVQADTGRYYIVNECNGKVLDSDGTNTLVTYEQNGSGDQKWRIDSDNTISDESGLVIDIKLAQYRPQNTLIRFKKHGKENQQFYLQYYPYCGQRVETN